MAAAALAVMKMPNQAAGEPMEWNRSTAIALSNSKCLKCFGTGLMQGTHRLGNEPCHCVLKHIFRVCLSRFLHCRNLDVYYSMVRYDHAPGADSSASWTRIAEDYMADFYLIAKRTLDEPHWKIFRLHFILGADFRLCCRRLGMDRGAFFHAVYRIESKLGRVYREVRPYSLFPVDEYFGGTVRKAKVLPMPEFRDVETLPLRPPLAA